MAWKNSTIMIFLLSSLCALALFSLLKITARIVSVQGNCYYEPEDNNFTDVGTDLEKEDQGSGHKLAVLVPYRDRFEELMEFIPHMQNFLKMQKIEHKIYVLNQVDRYRFNRAALINVGFELSMLDGSDYIVMNDVDILPLNQELSYEFPTKGPVHLAAPNLHPMYHFPKFLGAIVVLTRSQFMRIDGMSNKYWGWGVEDDELYLRLTHAGYNIIRPENISTGIHNTFRHTHDKKRHPRDMLRCKNQVTYVSERDSQTGLSTLQFTLEAHHTISVNGGDKVSLIDVKLHCDKTKTPWCDC